MILFYKIITFLIYPLLVLLIYLRKLLKKEDPFRYKEKIFRSYFKVNKIDNFNLLWFHASSVGELNSVMPIIKEINSNYKNIQFLITTVTLSSGNLIKEEIKDFDNMYHRFLPIDVDFLIKDFCIFLPLNPIHLDPQRLHAKLKYHIHLLYQMRIMLSLLLYKMGLR